MLKKTLERLARQNYHSRSQYPEIYFEIEDTICSVKLWIEEHRIFSDFAGWIFTGLTLLGFLLIYIGIGARGRYKAAGI